MQVEDVARICFASRRATEGQRHLSVGHRLLGQVIVDDEHMTSRVLRTCGLAVFAVVDEVLAHCSTGHRRDVLQRSGIGSRCGHDDRVLHGVVALKSLHNAGNRGSLLTDRNIDADHVFVFLVDDGVDGDSGLTGLAVANDKFALATSDRNHGVDSHDTGLHRLVNRLAADNARSLELDRAGAFGLDLALAVDRHTERVHDTAEQAFAGRNLHDAARSADLIIFLDCGDVTEKNGADLILFEVLGQAEHGLTVGSDELEKLASHRVLQTVNTSDAVADLDDGTDLAGINAHFKGGQLLTQRFVNGLCGNFSH